MRPYICRLFSSENEDFTSLQIEKVNPLLTHQVPEGLIINSWEEVCLRDLKLELRVSGL